MIEKFVKIIPIISSMCILFSVVYEIGYFSNIDSAVLGLMSIGEMVSGALSWLPTIVVSSFIGFFIAFCANFRMDESNSFVLKPRSKLSLVQEICDKIFFISIVLLGSYVYFAFPPGHPSRFIWFISAMIILSYIFSRVEIIRSTIKTPFRFVITLFVFYVFLHAYSKGSGDFYRDVNNKERYIIIEGENISVLRIFNFGVVVVLDKKFAIIHNNGAIYYLDGDIGDLDKSIMCRSFEFFCGTVLDAARLKK